mgnify:CR=1 FL=1
MWKYNESEGQATSSERGVLKMSERERENARVRERERVRGGGGERTRERLSERDSK